MIVEKSLVEEEPKVPMITDIPKEQVTLEKVYYPGVWVMLHFNNEDGVYRKEDKANMYHDTDEEDMDAVKLED